MNNLMMCCYELMQLELRAKRSEHLITLLNLYEMIDLQQRYAIIEGRYYNPLQPRGPDGRWISTGSSGGRKRKHKYSKSRKARMNNTEKRIVSSAISTDHPKLPAGNDVITYEYANRKYKFKVDEFGKYNFISKRKIN